MHSTSIRHGHDTPANPRAMDSGGMGHPRSTNTSRAANAVAAFSNWYSPSNGIRSWCSPSLPLTVKLWKPDPSGPGLVQVTSDPTWTARAPTCRHRSRITTPASRAWGLTTTVEPSLMIPAFSEAISASVSPRMAMWSLLIEVMTATSGVTTLVASSRPPSPTSMVWKATGS